MSGTIQQKGEFITAVDILADRKNCHNHIITEDRDEFKVDDTYEDLGSGLIEV